MKGAIKTVAYRERLQGKPLFFDGSNKHLGVMDALCTCKPVSYVDLLNGSTGADKRYTGSVANFTVMEHRCTLAALEAYAAG